MGQILLGIERGVLFVTGAVGLGRIELVVLSVLLERQSVGLSELGQRSLDGVTYSFSAGGDVNSKDLSILVVGVDREGTLGGEEGDAEEAGGGGGPHVLIMLYKQ